MDTVRRSRIQRNLEAMRLGCSGALVGTCLTGIASRAMGAQGEILEMWQWMGAAVFFVPTLLFALRSVHRAKASPSQ